MGFVVVLYIVFRFVMKMVILVEYFIYVLLKF